MLQSSKRVLFFIIVFCAASYNLWRDWQGSRHPFISDVTVYYSYVKAVFIHHDLEFSAPNNYGIYPSPTGHGIPKMSMGLALVYTPFFLICHGAAKLAGQPIDGQSPYYAYGMYYAAMLFVFLGLFVLRRYLLHFYTERITSLTLICIFFGTNLFYYTVSFNLLTHSFLFTLNCLVLYYSYKWYQSHKTYYIYSIGFILGLSILIRPTGIFISLIPALWGCHTLADVRERLLFWYHKRWVIFITLLFAALPWVPQITFWKLYSGSYFYYSYGDEGFNFLKSNLVNVLFSFRKGWLLYTPIMSFSLIGFYFMHKQRSKLFLPLVIAFPVSAYVLSCWWCWSWGGSFSIRAFVEYYAFLAVPMASFFVYFIEQRKSTILYVLTSLLVLFNLYQTFQYTRVVIHWDNMSKEAYWYSLGKFRYTDEERKHFNTLLEVHSDGVPEEYKNK